MNLDLPLLNNVILELKQVDAFCSGACAVSKNSDEHNVVFAINDAIKAIIRNAVKSVDECVRERRQAEKASEIEAETSSAQGNDRVLNVLIKDMGFDRRVANIVHVILSSHKESTGRGQPTGPHWLSDIVEIPMKDWQKKPNMGVKGVVQLYWVCRNAGYQFDLYGLYPSHKRMIRLLEDCYRKENKE